MLNVEVVSHETMKPSTPTPDSKSKFTISYIDQITAHSYVEVIFYYCADSSTMSTPEKLLRLKTSLSDFLVQFYPLAGSMGGNDFIDCNDIGVEFLVAHVKAQMSDALDCDNVVEFGGLLPARLNGIVREKDPFLTIQANVFECGGLALGLVASHRVFDGYSLVNTLNSWAATATGAQKSDEELYEAWKTFPPKRNIDSLSDDIPFSTKALVTKRFIIDSSSISSLRSASNTMGSNPTRNVAVMALLWQSVGRSLSSSSSSSSKDVIANILVNLRTRMTTPPPPASSFGNIVGTVVTQPVKPTFLDDNKATQVELEGKLRNAINTIDKDYINKLIDNDNESSASSERVMNAASMFSGEEVEVLCFSSWVNFPCYEVDFGWGKPVWVGTANTIWENTIFFSDRKDGDGMEIWITLEEESMARLETESYFLSYASKVSK